MDFGHKLVIMSTRIYQMERNWSTSVVMGKHGTPGLPSGSPTKKQEDSTPGNSVSSTTMDAGGTEKPDVVLPRSFLVSAFLSMVHTALRKTTLC